MAGMHRLSLSELIRWGGLAVIASGVLAIVAELISRAYHIETPLGKNTIELVYQGFREG